MQPLNWNSNQTVVPHRWCHGIRGVIWEIGPAHFAWTSCIWWVCRSKVLKDLRPHFCPHVQLPASVLRARPTMCISSTCALENGRRLPLRESPHRLGLPMQLLLWATWSLSRSDLPMLLLRISIELPVPCREGSDPPDSPQRTCTFSTSLIPSVHDGTGEQFA